MSDENAAEKMSDQGGTERDNEDGGEIRIAESSPESHRALFVLAIWFGAAVLALIPFSIFSGGVRAGPAVFSVSLLTLAAGTLCGGLLGFLFGIPRSLQGDTFDSADMRSTREGRESGDSGNSHRQNVLPNRIGYIANTNLEQISDWLTKILVGVGLTQITSIDAHLSGLITEVAPAFGGDPYARVFAGALIIFGAILGFLFGYLWTRLFLMGALRHADRMGLLEAKAKAAERKVDELQKKAMIDAQALNLVERQLRAHSGQPSVSQQSLTDALAKASDTVKVQVFYLASDQRKRTWSDPSSKESMEATIPVFRALIDLDKKREYHQNHGQLGYALKDSAVPKYAEAEKALTTAIDIRDRHYERGWVYYELCRAVCIIQQDEKFRSQPPLASDMEIVQRVRRDLEIALVDNYAWRAATKEPALTSWCSVNGIPLAELRNGK